MDKEKVIKKIKQGAPATSAIVVAACIGMSLSGYQAPVYEAQAQTKETKTKQKLQQIQTDLRQQLRMRMEHSVSQQKRQERNLELKARN